MNHIAELATRMHNLDAQIMLATATEAAGLRDEMNAAVRDFNRACAADPKAAAEYARHKASQASCHWCGLPLRNRHCTECGDQDLPL